MLFFPFGFTRNEIVSTMYFELHIQYPAMFISDLGSMSVYNSIACRICFR